VPGETATAGQIIQSDGRVLRMLDGVELAQKQLDTGRLSTGTYYLVLTLKSGKSAAAAFMVVR